MKTAAVVRTVCSSSAYNGVPCSTASCDRLQPAITRPPDALTAAVSGHKERSSCMPERILEGTGKRNPAPSQETMPQARSMQIVKKELQKRVPRDIIRCVLWRGLAIVLDVPASAVSCSGSFAPSLRTMAVLFVLQGSCEQ